jgi:hypothetical protein
MGYHIGEGPLMVEEQIGEISNENDVSALQDVSKEYRYTL